MKQVSTNLGCIEQNQSLTKAPSIVKKNLLVKRLPLFFIALLAFASVSVRAQVPNIAPPPANLQTAPSGSLVIAMDNVLQGTSGEFNLKTYGLIVRLLNAQKRLNWVIRAGKAKDAIDFSAPAEQRYPTTSAGVNRDFRAGPFVIYPQDTAGVGAIINAYNATLSTLQKVRVYRLTSPATVDVRYTLFNPVKAGIIDEGGAYSIHRGFMEDAGIPTANYMAVNRFTINNSCLTFVSEPHNKSEGPWIDSVKRYVLRGGNFLAQCAAIITYESYAHAGRFQTTGGYDNVNIDINNEVVMPQPDLAYSQVHGLVEPKQGGNTQTYSFNPGSSPKNDWSAITQGSTHHPDVYGATVSDLLPNSLGGLVHYLGNHDYKADEIEGINGIRMYMNAFLTPSAHELCPSNSPEVSYYNPDFNVTYVNVTIPGNVSTNDVVPAGTTYGTSPSLTSSPAGSTATLSMSSTGSYTFTANTPGVYTYNVPVCVPAGPSPCPNSLLTITVLSSTVNNNPPVANTDIAVTQINTPVTLNSLANDKAGNPGGSLNPASVVVTIAAMHGTTSVNGANGNITYTPNAGYTGMDTLTYRVCDNTSPTALCATAKQIISILPSGNTNTTLAADDYAFTPINTAVSGNVKTNDTDPEGNSQTVNAQTTTVAAGTLVLSSSGSFTFTPTTGFSGPVSFVYTTCDNGVPSACASATLYILVSPAQQMVIYNPDFNVTYVNVQVPGNVKTNDVVPSGTTYGIPTLTGGPAGAVQTLTMSSNGTYTFVANMVGVYTYHVPVCIPGAVAPCPNTLLTITVLGPTVMNNPPVANTDIAFTNMNTPVVINTLANDKAGNPGGSLNPGSVTVTVAALHGTSSINPVNGNNTYTPNPGFTGYDTLTYQVCDNNIPALCATAKQIIFVQGPGALNTTLAADDYAFTTVNTPVSGNVKTNDTDPEGHTQTVTPQTTTVAGGTLVLSSSGAFTFTPASGFIGPVSFVYQTCDNGVPTACATATLYILVSPPLAMFNPDFNVTYVNVSVDGNVRTNDVVPPGTTYGTPTTLSTPAGSTFTLTMTSTGTYTFVANTPGVYTYNVPVCVPGQVAPCPNSLLTITVLAPNIPNNPPVANTDLAYTNINTPVIINTLANDQAGNPGGTLNPASVTVTVAAQNGTSSINPVNGNNTYTPNPGFTGYDTLTYQVCDNSVPALCATAKQIIFVQAAGVVNTTLAADDYAYTPINTAVTGNVKTNDSDPEGHTQTVMVQTTTIPGKGTLVLAANGSYTFTPVTGFTGPVSFVYTTCDNGVPSACASATLYVLVSPLNTPDFTPSHDIDALTFTAQNMQRDMVINISEVLNGYSTGQVIVRVRKISAFTITYDVNGTSVNVFGGTAVNNSDWIFSEDANFITLTLKPGVVIPAFGVSKIGVTITRNNGVPVNTTQNITTTIVTGSGGDTNSANNQVVTSITAN